MQQEKCDIALAVCARMENCRLPRWEELPDFGLYMDQLLALVNRYLGDAPGKGDKQPTAAMVNNYVKMKVMPAPVKKKYSRTHIAHLIMICAMKSIIPISYIQGLLQEGIVAGDDVFYNEFCEFYEQSHRYAAKKAREAMKPQAEGNPLSRISFTSALRAQAERVLAEETVCALLDVEKDRQKKAKETPSDADLN